MLYPSSDNDRIIDVHASPNQVCNATSPETAGRNYGPYLHG